MSTHNHSHDDRHDRNRHDGDRRDSDRHYRDRHYSDSRHRHRRDYSVRAADVGSLDPTTEVDGTTDDAGHSDDAGHAGDAGDAGEARDPGNAGNASGTGHARRGGRRGVDAKSTAPSYPDARTVGEHLVIDKTEWVPGEHPETHLGYDGQRGYAESYYRCIRCGAERQSERDFPPACDWDT